MLDGFEPLVIASGTPYLAVTKNGVAFNKSVVEKMEKAEFIQLFIDRNGRRFAISKCEKDDENSLRFYRGRDVSDGVRMNNSDLRETLSDLAQKDSNAGFRVRGSYQPQEHALIFDLSDPEPIRKSSK